MSCPLPFYIPRYVVYPDVDVSRNTARKKSNMQSHKVISNFSDTKSGGLVNEKALYFGLDLN